MNSPAELVPEQQSALVRPTAKPADLIRYHEEVAKLITESLKEKIDYGTIPGTNKPTLLKAGAERLCLAFGASPKYELIASEIDHDRELQWSKKKKVWNNKHHGDRTFRWDVEDGASRGIYRYVYKCRIVRPDGRVLGEGDGVCSTTESKYIDRPRDCENTACKMAQKRALVAAVLNAFGLSDRFTQDMEDYQHDREDAVSGSSDDTPPPAGNAKSAAKASPSVYNDDDAEMQKTLAGILKAQKVDEALWEDVGKRLHGKPSTELKNVLAEVFAR